MKKPIISTEQCLRRAKDFLHEKDDIGLIYAALELRFGIESRLKLYLEHHDRIPDKYKKTYRLSSLNKTVLNYLKVNEQIVKVTIQDLMSTTPHVFYYTPVRPKLIAIGQKLGNYLHYPITNLSELRSLLEQGIEELEMSNKGELMGPPLGKVKHGKASTINFISLVKPEKQEMVKFLPQKDAKILINIEYLDELI